MKLCWHRCFETLRGARIWVLHDSRDLGDAHVERRELPVRNWGGGKNGGRQSRGVFRRLYSVVLEESDLTDKRGREGTSGVLGTDFRP